ncbi:MAG TPA: Type 1 glutamine amidotransferase-like domain-containing protein [Thermodesulfovibrionales bacterium]|nr:Type 1 glutamine amidotransferase-like domain-containing protein [Thermodesulfovibrionales bacterium]
MPSRKGMIALMGSGELTATMVEVHKEILARLGSAPKAIFLDTPAGFQLNADQLSERAVEYFRVNVGYPMTVVSYKSKDVPALEAERAFRMMKEADYFLVGPGSPTYALRQWKGTPIPEIIDRRIERGACLVAASAAALTVGRFTLPVYEIYKVGEELRWVEGLDILSYFGLNALVIPHWNNAEGGNHDTRFCFMGDARFRILESMLPEDVGIIGLDEHTACLIDLDREEFSIKGIGTVTLRNRGKERTFGRGERLPLGLLSGSGAGAVPSMSPSENQFSEPAPLPEESGFWDAVHALEAAFFKGLDNDARDAANALLALDGLIWKAVQENLKPEGIFQARELLREFVVLLGMRLASTPGSRQECLAPLVDELLALRAFFKQNNKWHEADAIRGCLKRSKIEVDDTRDGYHWRLVS